ncbi:NRDE family protein [Pseudomaricurvus sp.]|uniref:NRDE family protein n=1 Tax=Pseudomaricurvus sp. TaxID=2004510 RepID=UPI003F6A7543
MCLILFALRAHADYPLIVAANRDEYFARPTQFADFWPDHPDLLAGKDLLAGGSWLGVNRRGQFAAVTNVRNGLDLHTRPESRGELVTQCLLTPSTTEALQQLGKRHDQYNGFNLLAGHPRQLFYTSNRSLQGGIKELSKGVYGLSNGGLDSAWPKVESGKALLAEILTRNWQQLDERKADLLNLLADDTQATTDQLPDTAIPIEKEEALSSRFIACPANPDNPMPGYGTRASTLVLFHRNGEIHFLEKSFNPLPPSGEMQDKPALELRDFVI